MTNIEILRKQCNLSRPQLSELIDVPVRTIENWEYGKNKPAEYVEKLIIEKLLELTKKQNRILTFDENIHSGSYVKHYIEDGNVIINNCIYQNNSLVENVSIFEITLQNGKKQFVYPSETDIYNIELFAQNGEVRIFNCLLSIDNLFFDTANGNLSCVHGQVVNYNEAKGYDYNKIMENVKNKKQMDISNIYRQFCKMHCN